MLRSVLTTLLTFLFYKYELICSFILIFLTVTDCMQNRHHFLSSLVFVTQHSNSHVHEDLKFKFFIVKVISSVVNHHRNIMSSNRSTHNAYFLYLIVLCHCTFLHEISNYYYCYYYHCCSLASFVDTLISTRLRPFWLSMVIESYAT